MKDISSKMTDLWNVGRNFFNVSMWVTKRLGLGAWYLAQVVFPHPEGPSSTSDLLDRKS